MWFLFKSMIYSAPLIIFQFYCGHSGTNFIPNFLVAMYSVTCTTVAIYWYLILDQDDGSSKIKKGSLEPENQWDTHKSIPALYNYKIQTHLSKIPYRFISWSIYMWFASALIFFVPFYSMGNIINSSGKIGDLWTSQGLTCFSLFVTLNHGHVFIGTNNYTWLIIAMYTFSLVLYPITLWLNNFDKTFPTYKTVFPELINTSPLFWLNLLFGTVTAILPYYLSRVYEILIKSPRYYNNLKID